jgi:hypothetical protein
MFEAKRFCQRHLPFQRATERPSQSLACPEELAIGLNESVARDGLWMADGLHYRSANGRLQMYAAPGWWYDCDSLIEESNGSRYCRFCAVSCNVLWRFETVVNQFG